MKPSLLMPVASLYRPPKLPKLKNSYAGAAAKQLADSAVVAATTAIFNFICFIISPCLQIDKGSYPN